MTDDKPILLLFVHDESHSYRDIAPHVFPFSRDDTSFDRIVATQCHSALSVSEARKKLERITERAISKRNELSHVPSLISSHRIRTDSDDLDGNIVAKMRAHAAELVKLSRRESRAEKVVAAAFKKLDQLRADERRPFLTVEMMVYLNSGAMLRMLELSAEGDDMICVRGEDDTGAEHEVMCGVDSFQYQCVFVEWPASPLTIVD